MNLRDGKLIRRINTLAIKNSFKVAVMDSDPQIGLSLRRLIGLRGLWGLKVLMG